MKKLAIIGASYLQLPLIEKAKEMGYETHVFAWAANDVGESAADHFYPISIIEKDQILEHCRKIGVSGICSIASDLAMVTVNYVANEMGLVGNSIDTTEKTTNKYKMRQCFFANGVPSPRSIRVEEFNDKGKDFRYPLIVKPTDRSGSRGINKITRPDELSNAIREAKEVSFSKEVLVEEFTEGKEYSIECISWKGQHTLLAITEKFTTDAPHFIETGHLQPALLSEEAALRIKDITFMTLDSLGFEYGASHTELKVSDDGDMVIIEVGGRMGGDAIGTLVEITTGIDFIGAVVDVAMGREPVVSPRRDNCFAAVRFIMSGKDVDMLDRVKKEDPEYLIESEVLSEITSTPVLDSSQRFGYFILRSDRAEDLLSYLS